MLDVAVGWFQSLFGPRGRPSEPTIKPPDTEECRIAVHEAGHAVVSWFCTGVVRIGLATIEPKAETSGHVQTFWREVPLSESQQAWCSLVVKLAGVAAEQMIYGNANSGPSKGDLVGAREAASKVVPHGIPWKVREGKAPPFDKLYRRPLVVEEQESLRLGYLTARQLLDRRHTLHSNLVSALLAQRTLAEEDLLKILGPRTFTSILGSFKETFLL